MPSGGNEFEDVPQHRLIIFRSHYYRKSAGPHFTVARNVR